MPSAARRRCFPTGYSLLSTPLLLSPPEPAAGDAAAEGEGAALSDARRFVEEEVEGEGAGRPHDRRPDDAVGHRLGDGAGRVRRLAEELVQQQVDDRVEGGRA